MADPRSYGEPTGDREIGFESTRDLEAITDHIERHWGKIHEVFHEIHSEYVHIDVHLTRATAERPYHVLITSGMSDRPMIVPEGAEDLGYVELMLALPADWPVQYSDFKDERNYWPLRLLKQTARFPHVHRTWLSLGHTLANGDPPAPYAEDVSFCAGVLWIPRLCEPGAWSLKISPEKEIRFFSLVPVFEEEVRFAWSAGTDALFDKLDEIEISEVIQIGRKNVCR